MFKNKLTGYEKAFWVLQTTGWLLYFLQDVLIMAMVKELHRDFILQVAFPKMLCGYLITLAGRYYIRKINISKTGFLRISFIIISSSCFSASLWYILRRIYSLLIYSSGYAYPFMKELREFILVSLEYLPVVLAWYILYFGIKAWMLGEEQKEKTEKAIQLARDAQLEMLRYQLNPHFLFNTLNSLYALTTIDIKKTQQMITKISEFLRYSLIENKDGEAPLGKEIEIIKNYLDIEQIRYGNKLVVNFNIEQLAEEYPVPVFLIHPLVENAIKHGFQTSKLPLTIIISAEIIDNALSVSVMNTGRWVEPEPGKGKGTGLENIKKRLEIGYPGNNDFQIIKLEQSVLVKLMIKKEISGGPNANRI